MPTKDPDSWMWERARSMVDRADRIQRRFFQLAPPGGQRPSWEPPIDMFETATELFVLVALPGVQLDTVEVVEREGLVRITGQRSLPEAFRRASVHRLEIPYGRFERVIQLPAGRFALAQLQQSDGCLVLPFTKLG